MKKSFLIILFFCVCSFQSKAQKALRAIDAIDEGDFNKAFEYLQKGLSKNATDPANDFVLAKIYSAPQFQAEAIDSAHYYIIAAQKGYQYISEKDKRKYHRRGMDSVTIQSLHLKIDSLAFRQAKILNSATVYNNYIDIYSDSPYAWEVIELRNKTAYAEALAKKTPEALSTFFKLYPNAPQAVEAREVFENLYYEQFVSAKTEAVYKAYLEERPNTIFAEKAAERLLALKSTYAKEEDLKHFYNTYWKYSAAKVAKDYHTYISGAERKPMLLSHFKNGEHHFFNVGKQQLEGITLPFVTTDSCKWIDRPFFEMAVNGQKLFVNLEGDTLFFGSIVEEATLIGQWLKLKERGSFRYCLIHMSGNSFLQKTATDFKYISPFYYLERENNNWWLKTFTGEPLNENPVDSIWSEKGLYFFKEGNKIALTNQEKLKRKSLNDFSSLAYLYTAYEWLNDSLLWLASNEYETVVDLRLKTVMSLEKASIQYLGDYYFVNYDKQTTLYDSQIKQIWSGVLSNKRVSGSRLGLKQKNKWALQNWKIDRIPEFKYDSIRVFNAWLAYAQDSMSSYLIFENYTKRSIKPETNFQILNSYNLSPEESKLVKYVLLTNQDKTQQLINATGDVIWKGENSEIKVVSSQLIYIKTGKDQLILNDKGKRISLGNIQAIGNYSKGVIPILFKNKFGVYLTNKNIIIPPKSDTKMTVFIPDSIFIYQEGNKLGLLNQEQVLIEANYQKIESLNDSLALVQETNNWHLININNPQVIIDSYDYVQKVTTADHSQFKVRQMNGFGILGANGKLKIPPIFNSLEVVEVDHEQFWIAERNLSEIDYKVLVYFDADGQVLFKEGLTNEEFEMNNCD